MTERTNRVWGWYRVLLDTPGYQVKELTLEPGKAISRQYHNNREEHWTVVSGVGEVTLRDQCEEFDYCYGVEKSSSVFIKKEQIHKLRNVGTENLVIIEVWIGDALSENDIVRLD